MQRPGLGSAPIELHRGYVGQQQQKIGRKLAREQRAGEVLLDDRLDAVTRSRGVDDDCDTATARADDNDAVVEEKANRGELDDRSR
jgi:hypothetical protein